jgi:hypothetical protein
MIHTIRLQSLVDCGEEEVQICILNTLCYVMSDV